MADEYCADMSLRSGESLWGTATAETDVWVVIEHDGPWGPKGPEDSGLPEPVARALATFTASEPRARVQLARRPERDGTRPLLWFAHSAENHEFVDELQLDDHRQIAELDFAAWKRASTSGEGVPAGARRVSEPLFFVCVHGRRDRCCAQRGMPVYTELSRIAEGRTWMTTHLGGHRFAPTLLVLPHGISYGRVNASEMPALVSAHAHRELYDLARVRGRTTYTPVVQAADVLLRMRLGERGIDALSYRSTAPTSDADRVTFEHGATGELHEIVITKEAIPPLAQSCGATPKPSERFVAR